MTLGAVITAVTLDYLQAGPVVKGDFMIVAGVKPDAPTLKFFHINNRSCELTVDIKIEFSIANSYFELVRRGARADCAERRPIHHGGVLAGLLIDDFVFRIVAGKDNESVIL